MSYDEVSRRHDNINRGNKGDDFLGSAAFLIARTIDPVIQYGILRYAWGSSVIKRLGGEVLVQRPPLASHTPLDRLGLSPYRTILFAMSVGGAAKQIHYQTIFAQDKIGPKKGVAVGLAYLAGSTINSLLFISASTSASLYGGVFPQTPVIVGSALYTIGLFIEWLSEAQRHSFKRKSINKGRLFNGGLFRLSRHINYLGYALWKTGSAIAAAGWYWGAFHAILTVHQFTQKIIPVHQHYLEEKYGEQFQTYKEEVPYKFIPWIY